MTGKMTEHERQRLELVKEHVSGRFYDREGIIAATANAVIASRDLHSVMDRHSLPKRKGVDAASPSASDREKLDDIRRKIDEGFYDNPNYLAELVEKLIRKLGLE